MRAFSNTITLSPSSEDCCEGRRSVEYTLGLPYLRMELARLLNDRHRLTKPVMDNRMAICSPVFLEDLNAVGTSYLDHC